MTLAGVCSETIRSATLRQYVSQSGFATVRGPLKSGLNFSYQEIEKLRRLKRLTIAF